MKGRDVVPGRQIEDDQVGALAGLQRAGQMIEVERPCADPRGHRQSRPCGDRRGIAADPFCEQRREPRLFEHVEIVVRRGAVGPDADVHSQRQHLRHRCDTCAELEVARGVVGDARREVLQRSNLSFVDVHAVRRDDLGPEQALLPDPRHDRHAVDAPRVFHLEQRFGEVRQQRHVVLRSELRAGPQDFRRACVGRMRCGAGDDERMRAPARDQLSRARERVFVAGRIRRRKSENRLTAERPQACSGRRLGHGLLEVVHVGEARHARADHLRAAECRAQPHELWRHELAFDGHDVAHQPDVESKIVGETAKQRHRHMGVRVDQAGHHDAAPAVDPFGRLVRQRIRPDRHDRVTRYGHSARLVPRELGVHGQHSGVFKNDVAPFAAHLSPPSKSVRLDRRA